MKRRKRLSILGILLLLLVSCVWNPKITVLADEDADNRMNVVFVMDQSGSMSHTDRSSLRYDALELFLGLSTEAGNYMGAIAFNDDIVLKKQIQEINGKDAKAQLASEMRATRNNGDTDIGKAIELATDMLQGSGNQKLRSFIILLSDGNTDLPKDKNGTALAKSEESKLNAISVAREKGIVIHSVCLNADGQAKLYELQDISDATGGTCVEVSKAEDLKTVFNQFYNIIYSTETINLIDTKIPDGGEIEIPFTIPSAGVEEANIIINTLNPNTSYKLFNPKGYGYIQAELDEISVKAKTFTIIKIPMPQPGEWKLRVKGITGDQVRVDMVYNASLTLNMELSADQVKVGDDIFITAQLSSSEKIVDDYDVYRKFPLTLEWYEEGAENETKTQVLEASGDKYQGSINLPEGDYRIRAYCTIDDLRVFSEVRKISFTADSVVIEKPSEAVSEKPEVVKEKPDPKKPVNVKKILLTVLSIIGGVLAVGGIGFGVYKLIWSITHPPVIRGRVLIAGCRGEGLAPPAPRKTVDGKKGKMYLKDLVDFTSDDVGGIDLENTYLIAGKDTSFIYIISKNPIYSRRDRKKMKKIIVDKDLEVRISSDENQSGYVEIKYKPY